MKLPTRHKAIVTLLPWTAGAGFATGQMMLSTQCTLPVLGVCSGCAGCAVALASLVSWGALHTERADACERPRQGDDPDDAL